MDILSTIRKITERWYLSEDAYFALYCLQELSENREMKCRFRVGDGKLEYNPDLLQDCSPKEIDQLMRIEMIRLFLKHPYERKQDNVSDVARALGSDTTIADGYKELANDPAMGLHTPEEYKLLNGQHFEWYSLRIQEMLPSMEELDGAGDLEGGDPLFTKERMEQAADRSLNWKEDSMRSHEVNELIKRLDKWGSIPGNLVEEIIASTKATIDYRLIVQGFRSRILSSKRKLTRMRPNRRMEFEQMGSLRNFSTRLLVAVDVSGSISDATLCNFYGVVNRMFRYGIEYIDCVQFDCELGPVKSLQKASRRVEITGRGGTSFQPIFDYIAEHRDYDGLVILTDGGAAHPKVDPKVTAEILWVCENKACYEECHQWMELIGRCCWMTL